MPVPAELVRKELASILACQRFRRAPRLSMFLRFIVEETLRGRGDALKEYTIGTEVYGRSDEFEPRLDPTVRVEARKLRARLCEYYLTFGIGDPVRIHLRTGSYVPEFSIADACTADSASNLCTRGMGFLAKRTPNDLAEAYECFWQAMVDQPNNPEAYSGLAAYYAVALAVELISPREGLPAMRMALAQEKQLGGTGPHAHVLRAILAYAAGGQVQLPTAVAEAMLHAHPRDPEAHFWYGGVLSAEERHTEALMHMREAAGLCPASLLNQAHVSWVLHYAGAHRAAYDHLSGVFDSAANDFTVCYLRARILAELGKFDEAEESLTMLFGSAPLLLITGGLGYVYGRAGKRAEAESILDHLQDPKLKAYVSPLRIAITQRALGYDADAGHSFQRAETECAYSLLWRRVDPQMTGPR